MKVKGLVVAIALSAPGFASAEVLSGVVDASSCVLVAKEDTTVGTMVGGATGGLVGAGLGSSLFGKSGSLLGGLAGAALGGAIGSSGDETHKCVLVLNSGDPITVMSDRTYSKGAKIRYVVSHDGSIAVVE
ncbi:MAG: hypothetical protein ACRCXB_11700 [Aeromonadaceae bacterium]